MNKIEVWDRVLIFNPLTGRFDTIGIVNSIEFDNYPMKRQFKILLISGYVKTVNENEVIFWPLGITEPVIHSEVTDKLPVNHPQAFVTTYCWICKDMIHAFNNECMKTWVECFFFNYCLDCFNRRDVESVEGYF